MKSVAVVHPKQILTSPPLFAAFGFGVGLSPVAPGTAGTLVAVPLYLLLVQLPWWGYAGIVFIAFVLGIYVCDYATEKIGEHDHPGIVWDEFVGFWITMFMVPFTWQWVLVGFLLFRLFDMLKPWPISVVDKHIHGGFGIMIDDVLAGLAAWLCLQILMRLF